jgi:hypothetical protein
MFTDISLICVTLKQVVEDFDQNSISTDIVSINVGISYQNLNPLDQLFMYTYLIHDILLTIEFKLQKIKKSVHYCGEQFVNNVRELSINDSLKGN